MSLSSIESTALVEPTSSIPSDSSVLFRSEKQDLKYPVSEEGKRVTLQEYWDHYYDHEYYSYEWNNGILEAKPMPDHDSLELYEWFLKLLYEYLRAHPIGKWIGLELGMKLEDSVRKPDSAVILKTNPIPFLSGDHYYKGACDLCIESLSTATSEGIKRDTVTKKEEYAKNGVKEYYILDDRHEETIFYRLDPQTQQYQPIPLNDKDVVCSQVLPGFCFRLRDVKNMTPLKTLAQDPFYSGYVILEYQEEKLRANQNQRAKEREKQRADQEQQRADQEKQRAEREKQAKEQEKQRADQEKLRAEQEKQRADQEKQAKEQEKQRADQEKQAKEQEKQRADQEKQRAEREKQAKEQEQLRANQERQKREQLEEKQEKLIRFLKEQGVDPTKLL